MCVCVCVCGCVWYQIGFENPLLVLTLFYFLSNILLFFRGPFAHKINGVLILKKILKRFSIYQT